MNFGKLMSAQISKQKTQQSPSTAQNSRVEPTSTKYLKRSDLEAAREAAYLSSQAERERERLEKAERKRQLDDQEAERKQEREIKRQKLADESRKRRQEEEEREEQERRKRIGLPELVKVEDNGSAKEETPIPDGEGNIEEDELRARLRILAQPIRLFGETYKQRLKRLMKLEERDSPKTTSMQANDTSSKSKPNVAIATTLEPVLETDMKVEPRAPPISDIDGRVFLARQLTSWFNLVLREWARALASRDEETKMTFTGKAALNSMMQATDDLKPLFRRLEKINSKPADLPDDLLSPIAEIVFKAQERRYVEANDAYLKLSIGKAAWPIGVTMVGIHERSAREKLHESDKGKAHIMADEATRKILQSIKRSLTFAQTRWPPEDIGQMMG